MASIDPDKHSTIFCPCGATLEFPSSAAGIELECPACGALHRAPVFPEAAPELQRAVARHLGGTNAAMPGWFRRLVFVALAFTALVALPSPLWLRPVWPNAGVLIGGALAWDLGLLLVWLGWRKQKNLGGGGG